MAQVFEEINKTELNLTGRIVDVCEILKEEAKKNKGITVAQYLRLRKLQKVEEKQFGR